MKNLLIIVLSFLGVFLAAVAMQAGSAATVLQEKDNNQEIQVQAGAIIELSLEEIGGTGYSWEFQRLDEKHFELVKTETRSLAGKARVGGPVLKTWWLKTKKAGESQLSLDYFRSWEGRAKAVKHFRVKIRIR